MPMSSLPPTLDLVAARRWAEHVPAEEAWLHGEVARRMEERLGLILRQPREWAHWSPSQGGYSAQKLLAQRYPKAVCHLVEPTAPREAGTRRALEAAWWQPARWTGPTLHFGAPAEPVQMLWANMCLHQEPDPEALIARWHRMLAVDGFLMFSCLGPDTLKELRPIYAANGWPPALHDFTDMHDWGDMLVHAGFAEPVMDMEHITLSFETPERLLEELRGLGRNLHGKRFSALRGRRWRQQLLDALRTQTMDVQGRCQVSFEIVYGHAFKPVPRFAVREESHVPLADLKNTLKRRSTFKDSPL